MKNMATTTIYSNMQFAYLNIADRFSAGQPRVAEKRHRLQNRAVTIGDGKQ